MNRLLDILAILLTLSLALTACSDDSCYDNGSSLPLATFYLGSSQQAISGLTVKGIGVPGDSVLANSSALKELYLPLQASTSSTSYAITRQVTIDTISVQFCDTVKINYNAVEYFHSIECGAMFNFDITSVSWTENAIDSVVVLIPLVTNSRTPAMRIYFTEF